MRILAEDPYARVACEVAVTTGFSISNGWDYYKISYRYSNISPRVIRDIGYDREQNMALMLILVLQYLLV